MPMADWPSLSLSLIKPCAGSHIVECSALPGGEQLEELCMASRDWPIPPLSIRLRNCTIDKVSVSIAMAFFKSYKTGRST